MKRKRNERDVHQSGGGVELSVEPPQNKQTTFLWLRPDVNVVAWSHHEKK